MFRIKICGITTPDDALLAASAGADAIGLNFYEKSPRYITPEQGSEIARALQKSCDDRKAKPPEIFGVFVHPHGLLQLEPGQGDPLHVTLHELYETRGISKFSGFQLHGNEPPQLIADINADHHVKRRSWLSKFAFPDRPTTWTIRAFRCAAPDLSDVNAYLLECARINDELALAADQFKIDFTTLPHAILLDAHAPGTYGGTGQTLDWASIPAQREKLLGLPLILAGGLTPDNVAEAIRLARPDAVDVASGVESSPGQKDLSKLRDFIAAAKSAFAALDKT